MFAKHVIRVALRVREIKITVRLVQEIYLCCQTYAMPIVLLATSNRQVSVRHATSNVHSVEVPLQIVVRARLMELMNHFWMEVPALMTRLAQLAPMQKQ